MEDTVARDDRNGMRERLTQKTVQTEVVERKGDGVERERGQIAAVIQNDDENQKRDNGDDG